MTEVSKAKMLVAMHKAADVPSDDFYLPVQVGHALSDVDLGIQADDQGLNISNLNRSYCELTALYWAWKNLDADFVGLSHYRRYFRGCQKGPQDKGILSEEEALSLMGNFEIVLSKPRNYYVETIDSHYRNAHAGSDLDELRAIMTEASPEVLPAFDAVFSGRKVSLYNMFLMSHRELDGYCSWLFEILDELGNRIDNDSRSSYQQRTFGFLGERLLNVWAFYRKNEVSVGYQPVVNTEGEPKLKKAYGMVKRKLR